MEPRYYDAGGRIDYEAIREDAARLRHEAIDAFWSALLAQMAMPFTSLLHSPGAPMGAQARQKINVRAIR